MKYLITFISLYLLLIFIFLIRYLILLKKKKLINMGEIGYLINKFDLSKKIINAKKLGLIISFVDAFIISITCTIIYNIDFAYIWQLAIGFLLLFILIYLIYGYIGKKLKGKELKKDGIQSSKNRTKMAKNMGRK